MRSLFFLVLMDNSKTLAKGLVGKFKSYPVLTGILLGLVFFSLIEICLKWFPSVLEAWTKNNASVRSAYFTVVFFAVFIPRLSRQRRRNAFLFWVSMCVFILLHVLFVVYYSVQIHPLLLSDWIIMLVIESFVLVFCIDWLTRRFRRVDQSD